jgi:hypothetical protein
VRQKLYEKKSKFIDYIFWKPENAYPYIISMYDDGEFASISFSKNCFRGIALCRSKHFSMGLVEDDNGNNK